MIARFAVNQRVNVLLLKANAGCAYPDILVNWPFCSYPPTSQSTGKPPTYSTFQSVRVTLWLPGITKAGMNTLSMMNLPALVNWTVVSLSMNIGRATSDRIARRKVQSTTNVNAPCLAASKAAAAPALSSVFPSHAVHSLMDLVAVTVLVDVLELEKLLPFELPLDELLPDGVPLGEPEACGATEPAPVELAAGAAGKVFADPVPAVPPQALRIDASDNTNRR
jgi:hypothetical protein